LRHYGGAISLAQAAVPIKDVAGVVVDRVAGNVKGISLGVLVGDRVPS